MIERVDSLSSGDGIYIGGVGDFASKGIKHICSKSELDDVTVLKSFNNSLLITGSNSRSVLFAAYRYLQLHGADWLWPGQDGEIIPTIKKAKTDGFDIREQASYRHRGANLDAAASPEIVIEFIDWMAKHRMNMFLLTLKTSQAF